MSADVRNEWKVNISKLLLVQYGQYLIKELGFEPMHYTPTQSLPDDHPLQQGLFGVFYKADSDVGVHVIEIYMKGWYFIVQLGVLERSRFHPLQLNGNSSDSGSVSSSSNSYRRSSRRSFASQRRKFLEETCNLSDLIHVHSFMHDFHLRWICNYLANRAKNYQERYHLVNSLDDFIQLFNRPPSYSRCHVLRYMVEEKHEDIDLYDLCTFLARRTEEECYGIKIKILLEQLVHERPLREKSYIEGTCIYKQKLVTESLNEQRSKACSTETETSHDSFKQTSGPIPLLIQSPQPSPPSATQPVSLNVTTSSPFTFLFPFLPSPSGFSGDDISSVHFPFKPTMDWRNHYDISIMVVGDVSDDQHQQCTDKSTVKLRVYILFTTSRKTFPLRNFPTSKSTEVVSRRCSARKPCLLPLSHLSKNKLPQLDSQFLQFFSDHYDLLSPDPAHPAAPTVSTTTDDNRATSATNKHLLNLFQHCKGSQSDNTAEPKDYLGHSLYHQKEFAEFIYSELRDKHADLLTTLHRVIQDCRMDSLWRRLFSVNDNITFVQLQKIIEGVGKVDILKADVRLRDFLTVALVFVEDLKELALLKTHRYMAAHSRSQSNDANSFSLSSSVNPCSNSSSTSLPPSSQAETPVLVNSFKDSDEADYLAFYTPSYTEGFLLLSSSNCSQFFAAYRGANRLTEQQLSSKFEESPLPQMCSQVVEMMNYCVWKRMM